jgi:hypothetical protein
MMDTFGDKNVSEGEIEMNTVINQNDTTVDSDQNLET